MQNQKIVFHSDIIQYIASLLSPILNAESWTITADTSAWRIIPSVNLKSQHNSNPGAHYIAALRKVYVFRYAHLSEKVV